MEMHYLQQVDSTSKFLKRTYKLKPQLAFCFAEYQTDGYGRHGNKWLSNQEDVFFSVLLPFNATISDLYSISPLIAICVHKIIQSYTDRVVNIKWPNDLYIDDAKLAGILIEVLHHDVNQTWLVIGIGVNLTSKSGLTEYCAAHINVDNKLDLIESLVDSLQVLSMEYTELLLPSLLAYWKKFDRFRPGQRLRVRSNHQIIEGLYNGISDDGRLSLYFKSNSDDKTIVCFSDASIL